MTDSKEKITVKKSVAETKSVKDLTWKKAKENKAMLYSPEEAARIDTIGPKLVAWYEAHGRELPWRVDRDAYKIWISEIMLQQTRIEAVKPYFARFMEALPTLESLAQVEEERLLKLWEGLGYYSRARNLKKCAMTVVDQFEGQLPADYEALKKLPGIGPYTAGAIGSLAYGLAVPAVDGNVLRVLSRILLSREDIMQTGVRKKMEQLLLDHMPQDKPGQFNEGIMELGETVCVPNGRPFCEQCPLREDCLGYAAGEQEELPVKAPKKARRVEERTVLVLRYGQDGTQGGKAVQVGVDPVFDAASAEDRVDEGLWIALRKRPDTGLLAGLYELPALDGHLTAEQLCEVLTAQGLDIREIRPTEKARHIFSHVEWDMTGYVIELSQLPEQSDDLDEAGYLFVERRALQQEYALPTAFKAFRKWIQ